MFPAILSIRTTPNVSSFDLRRSFAASQFVAEIINHAGANREPKRKPRLEPFATLPHKFVFLFNYYLKSELINFKVQDAFNR